jgi:hypothetical protein
MWRMTPRLATAALTATLALTALTLSKAQASAVQSFSYTTSGAISDTAGPAPITFQGMTTPATLTTPGSFVLGDFVTSGTLPPSATLTYNNTPFTVDLVVSATPIGTPVVYTPNNSSFALVPATYDYKLSGLLNGWITGAGSTDMVATVTSISGNPNGPGVTPPFGVASLNVAFPQGITAPNNGQNGITPLMGSVTAPGLPAPSPEPTSVAAFAIGLVGWGIRRRLRSRA